MNFEKGKFYYVAGEDMEFLEKRENWLGIKGETFWFRGDSDKVSILRFGVDFDAEDMNSMRPIPDDRKAALLARRAMFDLDKAEFVARWGAD